MSKNNLYAMITMAIMLLLIAVKCHGAEAATLSVPSEYSTIQAAIDTAVSGVDTVIVDAGIYMENINFAGKAITVRSINGATSTIIDGGNNGSVVTFNSGEGSNSVLDGFTIQHGYASYGGGILCWTTSSPTIINCTITDNKATSYGSGICCYYKSSPTITNCTITNNQAKYEAVGVFSYNSAPSITNCVISGNTILP